MFRVCFCSVCVFLSLDFSSSANIIHFHSIATGVIEALLLLQIFCLNYIFFLFERLCESFFFYFIEGDLTDPVSGPRSSASDPQTVITDTVVKTAVAPVRCMSVSRSPTFHYNPFHEDSDTNTSADVTPVHTASRHDIPAGDDPESTSTDLEVIRYVSVLLTEREHQCWKMRSLFLPSIAQQAFKMIYFF